MVCNSNIQPLTRHTIHSDAHGHEWTMGTYCHLKTHKQLSQGLAANGVTGQRKLYPLKVITNRHCLTKDDKNGSIFSITRHWWSFGSY